MADAINDVGFIGLGIMGRSMARNLQKAGWSLHIYSRTRAKCTDLIDEGMIWHDTVADLAPHCQAVITMVGYPEDVEQVYFGEDGLIAHAAPGTILIDMTTTKPDQAQRIHGEAAARAVHALDAPVSGGDIGAREARLAIMVGGDEAAFQAALPLFQALGKTIARLGPAGAGQHTKMVNQIVIAGTIMGVAEAMAYARRSGLDPNQVLDVIGGGAASGFQLNTLGPKMVAGDHAPGFFVHHFQKDMSIAAQAAEEMGLSLEGLATAREQFGKLADGGGRELGTHGLIRLYEE